MESLPEKVHERVGEEIRAMVCDPERQSVTVNLDDYHLAFYAEVDEYSRNVRFAAFARGTALPGDGYPVDKTYTDISEIPDNTDLSGSLSESQAEGNPPPWDADHDAASALTTLESIAGLNWSLLNTTHKALSRYLIAEHGAYRSEYYIEAPDLYVFSANTIPVGVRPRNTIWTEDPVTWNDATEDNPATVTIDLIEPDEVSPTESYTLTVDGAQVAAQRLHDELRSRLFGEQVDTDGHGYLHLSDADHILAHRGSERPTVGQRPRGNAAQTYSQLYTVLDAHGHADELPDPTSCAKHYDGQGGQAETIDPFAG